MSKPAAKSKTGGLKRVDARHLMGGSKTSQRASTPAHPDFIRVNGPWAVTRHGDLWHRSGGVWAHWTARTAVS